MATVKSATMATMMATGSRAAFRGLLPTPNVLEDTGSAFREWRTRRRRYAPAMQAREGMTAGPGRSLVPRIGAWLMLAVGLFYDERL